MSTNMFINSAQLDTMNTYLDQIADGIGAKADLSTWFGIQSAVRAGLASQLFPVGSQLMVNHSVYGNSAYDVVAHDYLKSVHDPDAHTMTLLKHDIAGSVQFDAPEAFDYANTARSAGTYHFTIVEAYGSWAAGTYQFTTTQTLPVGGQFTLNGSTGSALTALKVRAFSSQTATTATEECVITAGSGGTSLGTFGVELNAASRVSYGSNNYKESAIRQFLNSRAAAGSVWTPQTKFDRPPNWFSSLAGFTGGLDADFLAVVGEVVLPCAANNTYESPDSTTPVGAAYTLHDKFYLASCKEIIGMNVDVDDNSVQFPFYAGATNADRIKHFGAWAAGWWMRTPNAAGSFSNRLVLSDGTVLSAIANDPFYAAPACTIV